MNLRAVYRVSVVVPVEQMQAVLDGVRATLPLRGGNYADWAFISASGEEQFRPLADARPAQGVIGELERVASQRIEFCIERDAALLSALVEAIRAHHPWQVPAIFVDESHAPQL
ncbi:hypothetical protein [Dokdonella sp.]|uniref:hypothetical protein n=1 Tax=Dokdonella sp. TaxID=2291710 RepID=UPI0025C0A753|nr:hypothetical protein [Dokdonella sp.]MBX3689461.1 hypothetical protein [Dokdonella sp.]